MAECATPAGCLICVSLIDEEILDRDELIAEAYAQLEAAMAQVRLRVTDPSTSRFFEARQIAGRQCWLGQFLVATAPAKPATAAATAAALDAALAGSPVPDCRTQHLAAPPLLPAWSTCPAAAAAGRFADRLAGATRSVTLRIRSADLC